MANTKITGLTASAGVALADLVAVVDDPSGTAATQKATAQQVLDALGTTKGDLYVFDGTNLARVGVGSDDQVVTADAAESSGVKWAALPAELGIAASDESTAIDATGTKATFRMPHAMTVTEVRASLTGATTTGTVTVDINDGGTTILSTKLTVDATEKTSTTAATAAVISDSALADDAEITVDVDDVGDGTATGLKIWLLGTRA